MSTKIGQFLEKFLKYIDPTKILLFGYTIYILIGWALLSIPYIHLKEMSVLEASMFQTISAITTTGFNTIPIENFSISTLFLLSILMTIGASPSGTGGGIKSTTIAVLFALMRSIFKNDKNIKFLGKVLPPTKVKLATCNFTFYLLILCIGIFMLSLVENQNLQNLLFE